METVCCSQEQRESSTMKRDETFGKLTTAVSLHILVSDILHTMGSMNRPRSKGKYHATFVRKVTCPEGYK